MSRKNIMNLDTSATSGTLVSSLSGTNDHIARFVSPTVIQDSVITLTDAGLLTGAQGLQLLQQASNPGSLPTFWAQTGNTPWFGETQLATITSQTINASMGSNPVGSTINVMMTFTKIGKQVNCTVNPMIGTINSILSFIGTNTIPAAFLPSLLYEFPFNALVNGGYDPGAVGCIVVDTAGDMEIRRDASLTQPWPGANSGWNGISLAWLTN